MSIENPSDLGSLESRFETLGAKFALLLYAVEDLIVELKIKNENYNYNLYYSRDRLEKIQERVKRLQE